MSQPPSDPSNFTYGDYSRPDPPHQPLYLNLMLRHLRSDPKIQTVLDAGCGDGNFAASIAQAGFKVYGFDLSKGGIARAIERYPAVEFKCASIYDSFTETFPGVTSFDAIISVEVIEHLYAPRTFVRRAYEALRPGGLLILTTPYWGYLKNVVLAVTNRMDRVLTTLWDGGHIKHWSFKTMNELLTEQPFEFIAFHGAGRPIPYLWNGMLTVYRKKA